MSKKTKPSSTFEVWSAGKLQTTITGHKEAALIEARHWAWIFRGYLPVEIFEVTRTLCSEEAPYTCEKTDSITLDKLTVRTV